MPSPFDGCVPASGVDHAHWIIDSLEGRAGVGFIIPARFDRCVRVLHALEGETWAQSAPQYLLPGEGNYEYPFPGPVQVVEGDMGRRVVDRLLLRLARQAGGGVECHFGLWDGWGDMQDTSTALHVAQAGEPAPAPSQMGSVDRARQSFDFLAACPTLDWWGGRTMKLFDGGLGTVRSIGSASPWVQGEVERRSPQWWWPEDRSWFVANEIDFPWSYLAGPDELVEQVLAEPSLETIEVSFDDRW